jgi:hypothetical protein
LFMLVMEDLFLFSNSSSLIPDLLLVNTGKISVVWSLVVEKWIVSFYSCDSVSEILDSSHFSG